MERFRHLTTRKFLFSFFIVFGTLYHVAAFAQTVPSKCSVFTLAKGDQVFFGGNDDYIHPDSYYWVDPGDMRTQMHQEAFPGEDISDRSLPAESVPGLLSLLDGDLPSGRYVAKEIPVLAGQV